MSEYELAFRTETLSHVFKPGDAIREVHHVGDDGYVKLVMYNGITVGPVHRDRLRRRITGAV